MILSLYSGILRSSIALLIFSLNKFVLHCEACRDFGVYDLLIFCSEQFDENLSLCSEGFSAVIYESKQFVLSDLQ